jgi:hypothetical protein
MLRVASVRFPVMGTVWYGSCSTGILIRSRKLHDISARAFIFVPRTEYCKLQMNVCLIQTMVCALWNMNALRHHVTCLLRWPTMVLSQYDARLVCRRIRDITKYGVWLKDSCIVYIRRETRILLPSLMTWALSYLLSLYCNPKPRFPACPNETLRDILYNLHRTAL